VVPTRRSHVRTGIAVSVAALLVAVAAPAEAKPRRRAKRSNMPAHWVWPPTREMRAAGARCTQELTRLGVPWRKGPRTRKVATPIVLPQMQVGGLRLTPTFRKPPFVMDCHLALAFARHGHILSDAGVRELRFSTIHEYRRIRLKGRTGRGLSRHALGLAIDVYEMVMEDGAKLVVADDYGSSSVLREVERQLWSSGAFRGLLTPGNDRRSHSDHFHFEAKMIIESPSSGVGARGARTTR
jgi:hypothetical protein